MPRCLQGRDAIAGVQIPLSNATSCTRRERYHWQSDSPQREDAFNDLVAGTRGDFVCTALGPDSMYVIAKTGCELASLIAGHFLAG